MGIYTEKREQLIEKIEELEKHIERDTAKKKTLEDKLREVSHLAMAEEFNCKPRELDEIISSEHQLLEKLRTSGLSNEELLEMVGINSAQNSNVNNDEIKFYDEPDNDDD
ncbi:MAG: hypothetical protein MJ100_10825 [Ruminococcus sp.]|nr:hypothetical protein [Ruminococcus sp.]